MVLAGNLSHNLVSSGLSFVATLMNTSMMRMNIMKMADSLQKGKPIGVGLCTGCSKSDPLWFIVNICAADETFKVWLSYKSVTATSLYQVNK